MQIYRANNPAGGVDALELESWVIALQRQYGFGLERVWHPELTLGGVFALLRASAP